VEEEEEVAEGGDVADLLVGDCGVGVGCVVNVGWCSSGRLGGVAGSGTECRINSTEVNVSFEGQQCRDVPDVVFAGFAWVHWICDRDVFGVTFRRAFLFLREI